MQKSTMTVSYLRACLIHLKSKIVIWENPCLKDNRHRPRIKGKENLLKSASQNPNPPRPIPWAEKVIRAS